jgi:hypothetical protein
MTITTVLSIKVETVVLLNKKRKAKTFRQNHEINKLIEVNPEIPGPCDQDHLHRDSFFI